MAQFPLVYRLLIQRNLPKIPVKVGKSARVSLCRDSVTNLFRGRRLPVKIFEMHADKCVDSVRREKKARPSLEHIFLLDDQAVLKLSERWRDG